MRIRDLALAELEPETAYGVWQLRQQVFLLEQACLYPDLDGRDVEPGTRHVVLQDDGRVLGYLRVLDDLAQWRIGRVVLHRDARGRGHADELMHHALALTTGRDVVLDAQSPLAGWYATLGFEQDGEEFDDDGILHIPMRLTAH